MAPHDARILHFFVWPICRHRHMDCGLGQGTRRTNQICSLPDVIASMSEGSKDGGEDLKEGEDLLRLWFVFNFRPHLPQLKGIQL